MAGDRAFRQVTACAAHAVPGRPPIRVQVGQVVEVGARDTTWPAFVFVTAAQGVGWIPSRCLAVIQGIATVLADYDTTELSTEVGDVLDVAIVDEESGWLWCKDTTGAEGWIPVTLSTGERDRHATSSTRASPLAGRAGQVRVNSRPEVQRSGHLLQNVRQGTSLLIVQVSAEQLIELWHLAGDAGHEHRASVGKSNVEGPPVGATTVTLDPARGLQLIDESNHVVAVDAQRIGQLLLRLAPGLEVTEHSERARGNRKRGKPIGEELCGARAHLREQEGQGRRIRRGRRIHLESIGPHDDCHVR